MTDYSNIIWNENPVNGALHDWHGVGSSGILIHLHRVPCYIIYLFKYIYTG